MKKYEFYVKVCGIPEEIVDFFFTIFALYEAPKKVKNDADISFAISESHEEKNKFRLFANYGNLEIELDIMDKVIIASNLLPEKEKIALEWLVNYESDIDTNFSKKNLAQLFYRTKSALNIL